MNNVLILGVFNLQPAGYRLEPFDYVVRLTFRGFLLRLVVKPICANGQVSKVKQKVGLGWFAEASSLFWIAPACEIMGRQQAL